MGRASAQQLVSAAIPRASQPSQRYFEPSSALHRVLQEAPYLARCSDDKTAARVRPREYAVCYPYMQVNRPGMVSWLIFDLDHPNALIWDELGLPAPNLIVRNRNSGHAHLYYAIATVCTTENGRSAPIAYMKAVYQAYALLLSADLEYASGPVAKTPGHPWWDTTEYHNHVYDLGELAESVELAQASPWSKGPQLKAAEHSRHCILFEQIRYYAYSIVNQERESGSFQHFVSRLNAFAYNHNDFKAYGHAEKLPISSLKATVKSVSRWSWDCYRGSSRCHRGAMALPADMPLAEKQHRSAQRTHSIRHQATESKIRSICRRLNEAGEKLTISAIARLAKLTRQTVAAYRHLLIEPSSEVVSFPREGATGVPTDVKYGVHQVPAAVGPALSFNDLHLIEARRAVPAQQLAVVEPKLPLYCFQFRRLVVPPSGVQDRDYMAWVKGFEILDQVLPPGLAMCVLCPRPLASRYAPLRVVADVAVCSRVPIVPGPTLEGFISPLEPLDTNAGSLQQQVLPLAAQACCVAHLREQAVHGRPGGSEGESLSLKTYHDDDLPGGLITNS